MTTGGRQVRRLDGSRARVELSRDCGTGEHMQLHHIGVQSIFEVSHQLLAGAHRHIVDGWQLHPDMVGPKLPASSIRS